MKYCRFVKTCLKVHQKGSRGVSRKHLKALEVFSRLMRFLGQGALFTLYIPCSSLLSLDLRSLCQSWYWRVGMTLHMRRGESCLSTSRWGRGVPWLVNIPQTVATTKTYQT